MNLYWLFEMTWIFKINIDIFLIIYLLINYFNNVLKLIFNFTLGLGQEINKSLDELL